MTPAAFPAEIAELAEDFGELPIGPYMDQAREVLIDRLIEGKTVHTLTSRDIFDGVLDDASTFSYHEAISILDSALGINCKWGDGLSIAANEIAAKAKEIIEAFVDAHQEWIKEEAEQIAADDYEERE